MDKVLVLFLLTLVNSVCLAEQNISTASNCDFLGNAGDVSRFSCGILQVPENHDEPSGRQINIAYLVLKSENSSTKEFPMIYFTVGQALTNVQRLLANPILKTRDLIYFDQRGIGKSSPLPDITT